MKRINFVMIFGILLSACAINAQENKNDEQKGEKQSYYEQRAKKEALYEQSLKDGELEDEESFWQSQQAYEKNLRK